MKTQLNNLISFGDFKDNWKAEQAKKTKRTETGLDILKENINDDISDENTILDEPVENFPEEQPNVEEIIPEGLPEDDLDEPDLTSEKIEKVKNSLEDLNEDIIDYIVNYLRDVLLEMEQQGFIEEDFTDDLDDIHDGDWISWINDVIELPDISEEALDEILTIIENSEDEIGE